MSKVYNKIVQSNTEPSKNDIWLKDDQMKTFGKEGWKSVGGGVSEEDLNKLVEGSKEVLYIDITNIQEEGSFIMSYDDYKNHIVYFTATANKVTFIGEKVFSTAINYYGSVCYEDAYLFRCNVKSSPDAYPVDTLLLIVVVDVDKNSVTLKAASYVKQIIPFSNGDGTKFLSDDGSYKEIGDTNSSIFIDFSEEETIAAPDGLSSDITDNVYLRYYPDRYTGCIAKAISYMPNDGYTQFTFRVDNYGGDEFKGFIRCCYDHSDNTISFTKYPDIDIKVIEEIYEGMISFEQRIAALEGANA